MYKRQPRDRYVLADKLPLSHLKEEADMERFFQEQLEKCGVSYFDYYMPVSYTHLVPTGALLSSVSFNEGQSIPGIAHAVVIEHIDS